MVTWSNFSKVVFHLNNKIKVETPYTEESDTDLNQRCHQVSTKTNSITLGILYDIFRETENASSEAKQWLLL